MKKLRMTLSETLATIEYLSGSVVVAVDDDFDKSELEDCELVCDLIFAADPLECVDCDVKDTLEQSVSDVTAAQEGDTPTLQISDGKVERIG